MPAAPSANTTGSTPDGGQRTKSWVAAWLARLSSGWGRMPSTRVTTAPTATAELGNRLGRTTTGPPGAGPLKNIRTITPTYGNARIAQLITPTTTRGNAPPPMAARAP